MAPGIISAICGSCGKPLRKNLIGDFFECSNFDCGEYDKIITLDEILNEED